MRDHIARVVVGAVILGLVSMLTALIYVLVTDYGIWALAVPPILFCCWIFGSLFGPWAE